MQGAPPARFAEAYAGHGPNAGLFYALLLLDCLAFWCVAVLAVVDFL
jgi:hypothetical protein